MLLSSHPIICFAAQVICGMDVFSPCCLQEFLDNKADLGSAEYVSDVNVASHYFVQRTRLHITVYIT